MSAALSMQLARPDGAVHMGEQACRAGLEVSRGLCNASPGCLNSSSACNCLKLSMPCTRSADPCRVMMQPLVLAECQALPERCSFRWPCSPALPAQMRSPWTLPAAVGVLILMKMRPQGPGCLMLAPFQ